MAIRKKSIKVPINFGAVTDLADNALTVLGTTTIYIPENSAASPVTFSAAMLYVAYQSTGSTTQTISSFGTSVILGGGASQSIVITGTSGETGEDISGIVGPINYTNYFTASYGNTSYRTCQVNAQINTSAGVTRGVYAYLELSYYYNDTAAGRIQTICIPYESSTTTLPTTATTYATLKNLTGAGGLLGGYNSPVIRHRWLEVKGNTNTNGSTTDISMSYSYDAGAGVVLPIKEQGGGADNWVYYQLNSSTLSSTATHTVQLWNSTATRWSNIILNEWVSFEYSASGTTSVLNYIELPIEFESPIAGTTSTVDSVFSRKLLIQEPNNISLIKGAAEIRYVAAGSSTAAILAGDQASYRSYAQSSTLVAGQFTFNHGLDADSALGAAFTLVRGENDINISLYRSAGSMNNVSGVIRLLYSSSVAPSGLDSHSKTVYSFARQMSFTTTADDTITDSVQISENNYWLTEAAMEYYLFTDSATMTLLSQARLATGEGAGDGWRAIYQDSYISDAEYAFSSWVVRARPEFRRYPLDPDSSRMNIETSRNFRTAMGTASRYGLKWFTTTHAITGSIAGTISNIDTLGGTGESNIEVYRLTFTGIANEYNNPELFAVQTLPNASATYNFSVPSYDDTARYYVVAYQYGGTYKGVSSIGTPSSTFNIDINPSTGGGGEFYF